MIYWALSDISTHFILQELWYVVDGAEDDDRRHVLRHPGARPLRDVAVPVGVGPAHSAVPVTTQHLIYNVSANAHFLKFIDSYTEVMMKNNFISKTGWILDIK